MHRGHDGGQSDPRKVVEDWKVRGTRYAPAHQPNHVTISFTRDSRPVSADEEVREARIIALVSEEASDATAPLPRRSAPAVVRRCTDRPRMRPGPSPAPLRGPMTGTPYKDL